MPLMFSMAILGAPCNPAGARFGTSQIVCRGRHEYRLPTLLLGIFLWSRWRQSAYAYVHTSVLKDRPRAKSALERFFTDARRVFDGTKVSGRLYHFRGLLLIWRYLTEKSAPFGRHPGNGNLQPILGRWFRWLGSFRCRSGWRRVHAAFPFWLSRGCGNCLVKRSAGIGAFFVICFMKNATPRCRQSSRRS